MKMSIEERNFNRTLDECRLYFESLKQMHKSKAFSKSNIITYMTNTYNSLLEYINNYSKKYNISSDSESVKLAHALANEIKSYLETLTNKQPKNLYTEQNNTL